MKVFLSYRRADVGGYAGRLGDELVRRLGARGVFQDVIAIRPGQDFVQTIDRALDDCDAVLALIGPGWLTASTPDHVSRLSDPEDFVHMELSRAFERKVPVIPVLVGDADLPTSADLPPELRDLSRRQAVVLHDPTWHQDVEGLVRSLRGEPPVPTGRRRRWLIALAVGIVLAATAGAAWWRATLTTGSGTSGSGAAIGGFFPAQSDKPACPVPSGDAWKPIALSDREPTGELTFADGDSLTFTVKEAHWRPLGPEKWQVTLDTRMANHSKEDLQQGSWYYRNLVVAQQDFDPTCIGITDQTFVKPDRVGVARVGFEVGCMPAGDIILEVDGDNSTSGPVSIDLTAGSEPGEC